MILGGGGRRTSGSARPVGGSSPSWDLADQRGKVWALLEAQPELRTIALPAAVLVEGWVSA